MMVLLEILIYRLIMEVIAIKNNAFPWNYIQNQSSNFLLLFYYEKLNYRFDTFRLSKQNLSYTPRMQHYKTDGTGRDQYIVYNSGGNSVIIFINKIINI